MLRLLYGYGAVLALFGSVSAAAEDSTCERLLFASRNTAALPPAVRVAIDQHPASAYARALEGGRGLVFVLPYLASERALERVLGRDEDHEYGYAHLMWKGELKQSYFLGQLLKHIFPRADGSHVSPEAVGTRRSRVLLHVHESFVG